MFKRFVAYRKKRELAHKILTELIPQKDVEIYKKAGLHYFISDSQGRTYYYDKNLGLIKIERHHTDFRSLKASLKEFTESEIQEALQTLAINEHIEILEHLKPSTHEMLPIAISTKGRIAYDEMSYLSSKLEDIHPIADKIRTGFITLAFTLISGILLYRATTVQRSREENQQNTQLNSLNDKLTNLQKRIDSASLRK